MEDGKFVVITGPNGGGKSTLAKLIAGIETPVSGEIIYNGTDITNMSITERAQLGISFAFQQPVRFKGITVLDLLRLASKKDLSTSEACSYLAEVGLCAKDYVNREVNASLSGGELKRIEIGFNNTYLTDCLRTVDVDEVKIELSSSVSPIIIKPIEGDSFIFLIIPMRLKNENID